MGKERIGLDTISSGRFAGRPIQRSNPTIPDEPNQVPTPVTSTKKPESEEDAKAYLEGTRWLYDDESDYKRAQKKLAAEIAREKLKKELAKKARIEKAKDVASTLKHTAKKQTKRVLPVARLALTKVKHLERKKMALVGGAIVATIVIFGVLPQLNGSKKPSSQVLSGQNAAPSFTVISPNSDIKNTTSGKVAFDSGRGVASYTDNVDDINITVSQQALPERFKKDPLGELGKFAESIYAKDKMELDSTTAYSGVSIKGPQTTVFIKNDLLVFIMAEKKLSSEALRNYIQSLK
ncbi:MAG TPA: hypothetical protein VLA88_03200 [Candidatus Saccharimonadales bacterium]|nr:hypothetical protein [Candidatus Saccharimonadales bacterium]